MELVKEINDKTFEDFAIAFMKKYSIYTQDDRLDTLMDYIPIVIQNFKDCSTEEEYRMKAKKQDQTLATIQIQHKESGWLLYKPIPLTNAKEYKQFYYQTLVFSLVQYILFFQGAEFDILENNQSVGKFSIKEEQLPHLLGLENKFVSNNDCSQLEKIIPGYNKLSILDKILALVENQEKIIAWEEKSQVDLFNYYKNMQKNKEFLLMGRFFSQEEELSKKYNKVFILQSKGNQLSLYKKSNMNNTMQRNISKLILQKGLDDVYFPRSLQSISEQILNTSEALSLLEYGNGVVEIDGIEALIAKNGLYLEIKVPAYNQMLAKSYLTKVFCSLPEEENSTEQNGDSKEQSKYSIMKSLLDAAGVDCSIIEPYQKDNSFPIREIRNYEIEIIDSYDSYQKQHLMMEDNLAAQQEIELVEDPVPHDVFEELENRLIEPTNGEEAAEIMKMFLPLRESYKEGAKVYSKK